MTNDVAPGSAATAPTDPMAVLRTRAYAKLLILAAIVGLPVSAFAYGFLKLTAWLQHAFFDTVPKDLGFDAAPTWWPLPLLAIGGALVALAITRLPGTGGHSPADGFKAGGPLPPVELPGVFFAALATLAFGAVLGPEAPLIALGSGLGVLAVRLLARDAPPTAAAIIAGAGSFAAISALLGSPLIGAFLLLEASGVAAAMIGVVLLPGLLAAGVGTLVFIGLDSLTGFGTFSLSIPGLPAAAPPTIALFGWAIVFGLIAAVVGRAVRALALLARPVVVRRMLLMAPAAGLLIGALAIGFGQATGKPSSEVLFSGQNALPGLVNSAASWSVGALLLLIACKGLAYALSLASFRGGPVFPAIFLGAAGGIAASHLPGVPLVPAVAMGVGAMSAVMLGLPLTATLLATLIIGSADALNVMPLVIVAVVVAYVTAAWLAPRSSAEPAAPEPQPAAAALDEHLVPAGRG